MLWELGADFELAKGLVNLGEAAPMFDSIHIGEVIAQERKRHGMTQGEVAEFVGVSKAAVSKWELGASTPDIALLPKLAGLFSISLDGLLGYEANLTEAEIQEVRGRFFAEFRSDAAGAFEHLDAIVRLHYSSWPLLLSAAGLLLSASTDCVAGPAEGGSLEQFIRRAVAYCERVERGCPDEELVCRARRLHAMLLMLLPGETEGGLNDIAGLLGPNAQAGGACSPLLAQAHLIHGDTQAANDLLQHTLTKGVDLILASLPSLIQLTPDGNEAAIADCAALAAQLYGHFGSEVIDPLVVLEILFTAASTSLSRGDKLSAQNALAAYATVVDDLGAPDRRSTIVAPLHALAQTRDSESLGKLADGENVQRSIEGTLRIMRSHGDALSSSPWACLAQTEGHNAALDGVRRAIARLERTGELSDA